jgi:hypothetical protein
MFGFFKKNPVTTYTVEVFGKIPFYRDYLSTVQSKEGRQWKEWILSNYGRRIQVPKKKSRFLFHYKKTARVVVGIISDSSDGKREFPFSVFVILKRKNVQRQCIQIWEQLDVIYQVAINCKEINSFYNDLIAKSLWYKQQEDMLFNEYHFHQWPSIKLIETL